MAAMWSYIIGITFIVGFIDISLGADNDARGLFPDLVNLATNAEISVNATCGQHGQEFYCKLAESGRSNREPQCGVCEKRSPDESRRHPIKNAIDGSNQWWQSPTLSSGTEFEWVTITLDLKQIYQVAYVIVKSAISPRPGNWVLERSLDGNTYEPWQYYAISDAECMSSYGIPATPGRPRYEHDTQVICTSYFSKFNPVEGGEVHTSLVNGRPGAADPSQGLQKFTQARYVRLRLQKINVLLSDMEMDRSDIDASVTRRYFYSIKDISIGGRCLCNGHADSCNIIHARQQCSCEHNTCGPQCSECCPMYHQFKWQSGGANVTRACEKCECHNHADACRYDEEVDRAGLSRGASGHYKGGGTCIACNHFTTGINCEKCQKGYYRPQGVSPSDPRPCIPCSCTGHGTTGDCIGDDTQLNLRRLPGQCICRQGYKGIQCDSCAEGFLNYPQCHPCPCSRAGSTNKVCEGDCICKENVQGPRCDTCVPGTFHLDEHNKLGCTKCFCSGATDKCEAAKLPIYTIVERGYWHVSDLQKRRVVAARESSRSVRIAEEHMSSFDAYFWMAPKDYLGKKLTSYGQTLTIKSSWVKLRGDTSGSPTRCPDVIVEGGGFRIAYGGRYYNDSTNAFLEIPFYEQDWYHFPKDIPDIPINMALSEYRGGAVSREEMMAVLSNLETLFIRARYHTEQVESLLHDVILEYGKEGGARTKATLVTGAVERCFCPPGYTGLSCDSCDNGYRRLNSTAFGGDCVACDCNGHVARCDPITGGCGECLHNTVGEHCERCAPGFFGDPSRGTPNDCQPCLCPLGISNNHFTPKCEVDKDLGGFKCLCPRGYEGPRCNHCTDGYFGDPSDPDKPCQPCDCSGNVDPLARGNCDRRTGQCLKCLGNTAGPKCELCRENHYGDASRGQCLLCECHNIGSTSLQCNARTGQCECRGLYTGRQCDRCESGRGGVAEGCPLCRCDIRGSVTRECDPVTGLCPCKPGVGGRHCDSCLPNHFGDLMDGCSRCDCSERGSEGPTCASVTGQCTCLPHVVGRSCNRCRPGYWGLSTSRRCSKCDCDPTGTVDGLCDDATGECKCRPGVRGPRCDGCLSGYWGFSAQGCKPCEPCGIPGRSCDPRSGRCVCPDNAEGDKCERCMQGFWDYSADIGCRPCSCSGPGSLERQCDPRTGRCVCRRGYEGDRCDRCSFSFYGYPQCLSCGCDVKGTRQDMCREGICQCGEDGQCPCKKRVRGQTCGRCKKGHFGLSESASEGCFQCFCFGRSKACKQARVTWSKLALPGSRKIELSETETRLNITNQLYVIPETYGDVKIGTSLPILAPLYWQLPIDFMRDKTLSYNGYLRFRVETSPSEKTFPDHILQSYPLVSMQGNWQLVLEYYPQQISKDGRYEVRLNERYWRRKNSPEAVQREHIMIALQNIQHILIRATDTDDFKTATLNDVTLEIAAEGTPVSSRTAIGVEDCRCPEAYTGLSCQNPNYGFYRWYKENHIDSTIVIDLVGESRPCNCNGRSEECDQETGICKECRDFTAGDNCELCATGYYGDPLRGSCKPCACPSRQQNFAKTCQADPYSDYICHCKEGYTGHKCERCAEGYYGDPSKLGGSCIPCNCDPHGSVGRGCSSEGICRCREGITGNDCSQCKPRHVVAENGCISCEDGCIDVLLDDVEALINEVTSLDMTGRIRAPWVGLEEFRQRMRDLRSQLNNYASRSDIAQSMLLNFEMDHIARRLLNRVERISEQASINLPPSVEVHEEAAAILQLLISLRELTSGAIYHLDRYGLDSIPTVSVLSALDEAERILRDIKVRIFTRFNEKAEIELKRSNDLLDRVTEMAQSGENVDILWRRIQKMRDRVDDLLRRIKNSKYDIKQTNSLGSSLRSGLKRIYSSLADIAQLNLYTQDRNFNTTIFIKRAERNIRKTRRNFESIVSLLSDLRNRSSSLSEFEATLWRLNNEYKNQYVEKAEDHAMHLKSQAIKFEKLFEKTRDVTGGPLRAAQAYQRIVDALASAEEAARNASRVATKAFKKAYPGDPDDSLVRRSRASVTTSRSLMVKGNGLQERVDQLAEDLQKQKDALDMTRDMLGDSTEKLDNMDHVMDTQFEEGLSEKISTVLSSIEETNDGVGRTLNHIESMHTNLTIIKSYTGKMVSRDEAMEKEIRDTISDIEGSTMKGERLSSNLRRQAARIENRGNNLRDRIEALKRRIKQTRQHASSIRVSLTPDSSGICMRKYRPNLQPTTTSRLTLGYAINTDQRDSTLVYIGSANASDLMIIEMVDRQIHFTWDAGGGRKTVIHPLRLQTNNLKVSDETRWYHISVNRVGNIGELSVRPAYVKNSSRRKLYLEPVYDASTPGFSRMDLVSTDNVWIGGVPNHLKNQLNTRNFAGCLNYMTIDGENLGLWNFTESIGCGACNEGFDLEMSKEDKTSYGFNGKGYFKGTNKIYRPKPYYAVVLSFRSLDEDALLFLSANHGKNQYFSIGLEDGHVHFTVQFDAATQLRMRSEKKLNNMRGLIQIQAIVQNMAIGGKRMGRLVVGDQDQLGTTRGGPDLDLDHVPFYFGGVDPEFDKRSLGKHIELRSVLGCMGGLSVLEVGQNPHTDGHFYGIDDTCPNQPLTDVGFLGRGFLEMPSRVLRKDSNFGFTFKTMESDALLMISTFVGQDNETGAVTTPAPLINGRPHPPDFYSVSLVEGHLDLRLYAGSSSHRIMSKERYNDGNLHSFFVIKENRKIRLFVDERLVNSTRLKRGSHVIEAPREGGLFFGGVSPSVQVDGMVGSSIPLKGCIQDIIINNRVLPLNAPLHFDNAFLGRCKDLPRNAMEGMESDAKDITSCQPPKQHTVEYGALKFGDQSDSHAIIPVDKRTLRKDFEISLEFRTYYPSGLLFITRIDNPTHRSKRRESVLSVQLHNGRLIVLLVGKKKEKKFISHTVALNSGEWRKVTLYKKRRKLQISLDETVIRKEKIPNKNRFGSTILLGGVPNDASSAEKYPFDPFRGCLRNLVINGERYEVPSLTRQDRMVGVGQCFANVQPGSYFPGDAYAIYDDQFEVGSVLELRLEFRTWELNGVLLSMVDEEREFSLSMEVMNGAVLLSMKIGDKHALKARVSVSNKYFLCDNGWHTIKAQFIKDSITLRVDSLPEAHGFNGASQTSKLIAQGMLYVGGLPEWSRSGTLLGRENFKGCIRNIVFNSERRDWTDMYKLHHVLLNACPII